MSLRQSVACWWLERRARNSPSSRVVYNATSVLLTFSHPSASKAISGLLHVQEDERLAAVVSGIIDHSKGDPIEALHRQNPWALKDEKTWTAVLNRGTDGQMLVKKALWNEDLFVHKAAVRAVLKTGNRAIIPDLLIGMAKHSRYLPPNEDRQNDDRWVFGTLDAAIRQVAGDWPTSPEAISSVPELVSNFASLSPVVFQPTYLELLEMLTPSWTTMEGAPKCIPHLVAIYVAPVFHIDDRSLQKKAQQALNRIDPMWMRSLR